MPNSESPAGQVVTFYSFKGGTGRSMALANVAWILAANGLRVLVADWDLDSPGLHRFFKPFLDAEAIRDRPGIIDLLRRYEDEARKDPTLAPRGERPQKRARPRGWQQEYTRVQDYARSLSWEFPGNGTLDFLSAGRQIRDYSGGLDWNAFFDRLGGAALFRYLREEMKKQYDVTLIDSRTGLTDVADICTLHLPDTLVTCFTLSDQGIEGGADMARRVHSTQRLHPIRVLPVPMRVDQAEKEKRDAGRALARRAFGNLPGDLTGSDRSRYWDEVEVPYEAFYAYEETLATFGDDPGLARSLLSSYEKLTGFITQGAVTAFPRMPEDVRRRGREAYRRQLAPAASEVVLDYGAAEQPWAEWVEQVLAAVDVTVIDLRAPEAEAARPSELTERQQLLSITSTRVGVEITPARSPRSPSPEPVFVAETGNPQPGEVADRLLRLLGREYSAGADRARTVEPFPRREPRWSNLPDQNAGFIGRIQVMRELRNTLREGRSIVALTGMGGVGKTQLAQEYAHRFRSSYELIWWIDAEDIASVEGAIADLADEVGIPAQAERTKTLTSTLDSLRRGVPTREWLLILDNAEDPSQVAAVLTKQLPGTPGHVLVTSRSTDWDRYGVGMVVPVFEREESTLRLRGEIATMTEREADDVAEVLGDLPLAVDAAIGSLRGGSDVRSYLRKLEVSHPGERTAVDRALEATFGVALERLREHSPGAHRLLQIFSVMAPLISLDFVFSDAMAGALVALDPDVSDRNMRQPPLQRLERLSLVIVNTRNRQVQVHRLLQEYVRGQLTEEELASARHYVHLILAGSRPGEDVELPKLWPTFRLLWPHVGTSDAAHCPDPAVRQLMIDRVRYMWSRGDWAQGEQFGQEVAQYWETLLAAPDVAGPDDGPDEKQLRRDLLRLRHNLGNILRDQARFREAYELDEQTLAQLTDLVGEEHAQTLLNAGSFAADLRALGCYAEALERERRTSQLCSAHFGDSYPLTLTAANNLAVSLRAVGKVHEARKIDEELYERLVAEFGRDDPRTLRAANALGRDLRELGDYDQSVQLLQGVLDTYDAAVERDTKGTLTTQANLAASLRSAAQAERAEPLLDDTYRQLEDFFGEGKPETLTCRLNRAINLLVRHRAERAVAEFEATAEAYARTLGAEHPLTLMSRGNLAGGLRAEGQREKARELIDAVADGCRESLGADHPHTLATRMNLAVCLDDVGSSAAAAIMEEASAALTSVLGSDHPDSLTARISAGLLRAPLEHRDRVPEVRVALDALAQGIGEKHPTVLELKAGRLVFRLIDPGDPF